MMMLVRMRLYVPMLIMVCVFMRVCVPAAMIVLFIMIMMMLATMLVMMSVLVFVVMFMLMRVRVVMIVFMRQMHIEFHPFDSHFLFPRHVQVVTVEIQFLEFMFELMHVHAQVNQRANEHVSADSTENVEVEGFHFLSSYSYS